DRIRARTILGGPRRFCDHDIGRVRLIGREEPLRRYSESRRHAGAIFRDFTGAVVRSDAAVETLVEAAGDAAGTRKESVPDSGQCQRGGFDLDCSVSNPCNTPNFGAAMAIALNQAAMSPAALASNLGKSNTMS